MKISQLSENSSSNRSNGRNRRILAPPCRSTDFSPQQRIELPMVRRKQAGVDLLDAAAD
jgi:hypothetical protein